jgi:hypothetical protein
MLTTFDLLVVDCLRQAPTTNAVQIPASKGSATGWRSRGSYIRKHGMVSGNEKPKGYGYATKPGY